MAPSYGKTPCTVTLVTERPFVRTPAALISITVVVISACALHPSSTGAPLAFAVICNIARFPAEGAIFESPDTFAFERFVTSGFLIKMRAPTKACL